MGARTLALQKTAHDVFTSPPTAHVELLGSRGALGVALPSHFVVLRPGYVARAWLHEHRELPEGR